MAVNKSSPPWPSYAPLVHSRFIIGRLKAAVKAAAKTALYPTVARGTYEKTARRAKSHIAPCPRRIRDFSGSLPSRCDEASHRREARHDRRARPVQCTSDGYYAVAPDWFAGIDAIDRLLCWCHFPRL